MLASDCPVYYAAFYPLAERAWGGFIAMTEAFPSHERAADHCIWVVSRQRIPAAVVEVRGQTSKLVAVFRLPE